VAGDFNAEDPDMCSASGNPDPWHAEYDPMRDFRVTSGLRSVYERKEALFGVDVCLKGTQGKNNLLIGWWFNYTTLFFQCVFRSRAGKRRPVSIGV